MKENTERQKIVLAALLHDIGKFYQRADEVSVTNSKYLKKEIKNLEGQICPKDKDGKFTHKHVLWTAQFFDDFESQINEIIIREDKERIGKILNLASKHHNPDIASIGEILIQKADHYSSGIDRNKSDKAWKDAEEEQNWDSFKYVRMRSIFEGISLEKDKETWETDYKKRLKLIDIQLNERYLKADEPNEIPDYNILWKRFVDELKSIQTSSFKTYTETLFFLLEKYASRIPGSTQHLPDVSLFDHLKMTTAFAVCLYDFVCQNENKLPNFNDKPFLLIGADLSGIQKFIYGITSKNAAKNLKGRSFYLQLMIDNIVSLLIKDLDLYEANVVYKSGGGFYFIAPNTKEVKSILEKLEIKILDKLFDFHKTELFLAVDYQEFGEEEIFYSVENKRTIGNIWSELTKKLSKKKSQRFLNKIINEYDNFFNPSEFGGDIKRDEITGEEINGKGYPASDPTMNSYTKQQIDLGKKLRNIDFWIQSEQELNYFPEEEFNVIGLNRFNYFVPHTFFLKDDKASQLKLSADKVKVLGLNNLNFIVSPQKGINNIYGFTFYGGNKYPISKIKDEEEDETSKTFEELAGIVFLDEKKEIKLSSPNLVRIGILRLDVDNLGTIFKRGLSSDKRSFSRYSVLSRSLDYFFSGYLNTIWESNDDFKEFTQIIYSGGDDLFIVGKWDIVINFAVVINSKFRDWVSYNPEITLSGGISIIYPKFPVLKAAEFSEIEEKKAKAHSFNGKSKNSFSIFGYAFEWENELAYLMKLKDEVKDLIKQDKISKGFTDDIFNYMTKSNLYFDFEKNYYKIKNLEVIWQIAYNFKKSIQGDKDEKSKQFLIEWSNKIFIGRLGELNSTIYHPLQYLAIASRWAGMELR